MTRLSQHALGAGFQFYVCIFRRRSRTRQHR